MKVAICEDEKQIAEQISKIVKSNMSEHSENADIDIFLSGADFEKSDVIYDLAFLDCRLSDCNGLDIARSIRKKDYKTTIIFVTAYDEYVYESFEVNAFRYLLKPIDETGLKKAMNSFLAEYKENSHIVIPTGKKIVNICLDKIMYIEASEKRSIVRSIDGSYESVKSISDYQEEINSFKFFRTHRRFLVNMKYITEVENNIITLTNGEKVEISRRNLSNFNKCYMNYLKYSI